MSASDPNNIEEAKQDLEHWGRLKVKRELLVGPKGIPLDEFLLIPPEELF
jgi:hypothetical protein